MPFDPTLAAFRFGVGLSPVHAAPQSVDDLLDDISGSDHAVAAHPVPVFAQTAPTPLAMGVAVRTRNQARGTDGQEAADDALRNLYRLLREQKYRNLATEIARMVDAPVGFRERLVAFWADHFTVQARGGRTLHLVTPYIEEAIRPNILGRFEDLLIAATTHPMMMDYMQQIQSIGPNSIIGRRQGKGLNENLAREVMELHTLGVGGPYTQDDVTQLAELLSGLTYNPLDGFDYISRRAEPGAETILGVTYSEAATLETVHAGLRGLAQHPATAVHLARKLAVHFIGAAPDDGLVDALADQVKTGTLADVYATLLDHPAAWVSERQKVRTPQEYIAASFRALGVSGSSLTDAAMADIRRNIEGPMTVMGQPWQKPIGPDGWPEDPSDWIIPQTMAGRISWAMRMPRLFLESLPDPRTFVSTALGADADGAVIFAAGAAETRQDGIGVVLSSAAFQRR